MINLQDLKIWGYSKNDPIVIQLEAQLEREHMSAEEFMKLLNRPSPNITKEDVEKFCLEHYGGGLLTHWLED